MRAFYLSFINANQFLIGSMDGYYYYPLSVGCGKHGTNANANAKCSWYSSVWHLLLFININSQLNETERNRPTSHWSHGEQKNTGTHKNGNHRKNTLKTIGRLWAAANSFLFIFTLSIFPRIVIVFPIETNIPRWRGRENHTKIGTHTMHWTGMGRRIAIT